MNHIIGSVWYEFLTVQIQEIRQKWRYLPSEEKEKYNTGQILIDQDSNLSSDDGEDHAAERDEVISSDDLSSLSSDEFIDGARETVGGTRETID